MSSKKRVMRLNEKTKCKVAWYVTCGICNKKTYRYHVGIYEGQKGLRFCHGCMKKYKLTKKYAKAMVKF